MCQILVGLPEVSVLGVEAPSDDSPLVVHVSCPDDWQRACPRCGAPGWVKQRRVMRLTDLPVFGRPTVLAWHKVRRTGPHTDCAQGSWTTSDARIAAPRCAVTQRAGRWLTEQVGMFRRTVSVVAGELGPTPLRGGVRWSSALITTFGLARRKAMTVMTNQQKGSLDTGADLAWPEEFLDALIEQYGAGEVELTGSGGFIAALVKAVLERGLQAELADHLGYDKHDRAGHGSGNSRNGSTSKTLSSEVGPTEVDTPRNRGGTLTPQLVTKGERHPGSGLSDMIISLYAGGMPVRDIQAHLARTLQVPSRGSASGSAPSATTESESCSTPEASTGTSSQH